MQAIRAFASLTIVLLFAGNLPAAPATQPVRKVVLIAGKKSHGPEGNRIHDYPWSARLLKVMLDRSNVKEQLRVEYHLDGWPKDAKTLDDADTIMVISDGRDGDKFAEAPHLESDEHVAIIEKQMKRGCGLITFHFSTFGPDKYAGQMLRWTGGYFDWEEAGQRKWYSAIKVLEDDVRLSTPDHPVLRGVKPFRMKEEFYYNIRFNPDDKTTKPLLIVPALGGREPDGNVVAWARDREDGGRGFSTTCGHFYDNWKNDDFRKTVLNAIAWTAHVDIPAGGVESTYVEREVLQGELEEFKGRGR